jgi:predicted O-linked N-acetylglucosamine transferase (SPINDLY family)/glycosyltransferase involved in cell wall biosynthesis
MLSNNYVNISIVTFNRLEFTQQAIASIVNHTNYPYVITVVDNGSQDGTQEYLKEIQEAGLIKNLILLEKNIGVAKASNLAWLQEEQALYYLKYDNDIVIQKNDWLARLISVIDAAPEVGVIGYNFEPVSYPLKVIGNHKIRLKEEGNIGGACFLVPKRTHEILGYWCEDYGLYGFEDVDYSFRVKLAGLFNAYMEDEEIGIHLPAGKAPIIDAIKWSASDGIEEVTNKEYRNFKDSQLKNAIFDGIVRKRFDEYINGRCSLYINTTVLQANKTLEFQRTNNSIKQNFCFLNFQHNLQQLRIDLGCGVNKPDGFIGVDLCSGVGVDIIADLSKIFPFKDDSVDEVRAHDIIEHLQDRIHTMNEIWRVCKPGAKVDIRVPSTDGRGAFQDPTHVSFWNINSFLYYCSEFPAYLQLCRKYGFKGEFNIVQLEQEESPGNVIHVIAELRVVKPISGISENQINVNAKVFHQYQQIIEENDYLKFLFSPKPYFLEIDEADNYSEYLQKSLDYLHVSTFSNSDSDLWNQIVEHFAQNVNFIQAYFNDINLKTIYVKRAEIIEYFLKINGQQVDYDFADRPVNRKKIRLGILAAHFTPSAETFAYLPVYEYISRDFEVILYSLTETGHRLEQYCQLSANSFKLLPQNLSEQVNTIRGDDLDILFIATNVTAVTNPICLLAIHRLARIQVTSGGSVVTTGMRNIDYYISGTLTDPSPTAQDHYQEKLIKLEGTAHCFSYGTEEGKLTTPVERNSLGIPEDAVVFISGANYFKTVPELMETWAKIISKVSNSVLVLLPFGPNWSNNYPKIEFINHLKSIFSKHGLATERLIVLDPQPVPDREDMKEYYKIADVYLDSYPFAGTTSLIEPLQVNLPVIARQGNCFRSAMGAAIIQTLDIPNLVADSEESYIELAVALGTNSELRQEKSVQIKEKMQSNPSFLDSRSYSAKMGSLFQELFTNYILDTLSQNLRLGDINLIIFPDWLQPEELISSELEQVIKAVASHPDSEKTTLLININNVAVEDVELLLSAVAMNLLMEENLDVTEGLEISLVESLSDIQWQALLPRIHARIVLQYENQDALIQAKAETLLTHNLESLSQAQEKDSFCLS